MRRMTVDGAVRNREHGAEIAAAVLAVIPEDMVVRVTPHLVKVDKMRAGVYTVDEPVDGGGTHSVPSA